MQLKPTLKPHPLLEPHPPFTLSKNVMMMTETDRMVAAVINQEPLRTPSPRPIIFMYSFSRSSFSCTMPRIVIATGNSQAKIIARGNTHTMVRVYL